MLNSETTQRRCQLIGWGLFIISAFFYGWASLRAGDILGCLGSLFFFVACLVFLIPFSIQSEKQR